MSAQIRPNRMEVTDRFPMLGFAVRADQPDVNAEVVLATDIGLFQQQNRASRTAANFYSSREHGALKVPRGEGVFVVPPEVLARFIGNDRLFFGLASGPTNNGGLHVDAVPREGSPYVALRGFTGRTLRRSFGSGRSIAPPVLEWAGDAARPGTEPSNGGPAATGNGNGNGSRGVSAPAAMAGYDDGFGEMPVMPVLPGDQRNRAQRIGGAFGDRIGEALDLGLSPQSVDPLLNVLEPRATPSPMGYARSKAANGNGVRRAPAPAPRTRAMDGGVGAAVAIGGFIVETIRDSRGDISWDLDQFRGIKHPNDVVPASPGPFRDAPTLNLDDWPVWEGVDDISAWFKVDWQFNGNSLGNVRITNTGTNDAIGFGLHVTAKIMDDNQVYEGNCGALRITFHYRFDRSIGSEGIAIREITLYGDGTHAINGRWLQSSAFAREQRARARTKAADTNDVRQAPAPAPRARAMNEGAIAIGGFAVESLRDSRGDISWELDQFRGIKHPNDVVPASPGPFRDAPTINLDDWPVWEGVDDISAWFKVDWQFNGNSLGNVRITNTGTNDAIGFSLHVTAKIMDDNQVYEGNCGALRLTFHYRFDRSIGSEGIAIREITLYGDGTHAINGRWLQSSAFAREQRARARTKAADTNDVRQAPAPAPRARAMDGGVGVAVAIGGFVVETIRDSRGDISWDLDQFRGIKHPNDVVPASPGAFRDAPTINLDDWPVWEGVDDISAWFKVDWQFNGNSLGNVRITNTGTNDAIGFGLHVTAKIMDDNQVYEGNCGALRITFHYRFDRSIGSEGIAIREITLYGDGTHAINGRWLQSSAFAREQRARARTKAADTNDVRQAPAPAPRARAMDGGVGVAVAIGGFVVETIRDSRGDISWDLDQFRGIKHPNDVVPASPGAFRDAPTINLDDWPVWEGVDDISAWFKVDWQFNGNSLGNVRITNTGTNDAIGFGLHVTAKIMDDNQVYEGNCGALRITFHYRFDRSIGSEGIAIREITLYGDGTHAINGHWLQSSAFAREQRARRARA